MATVAVGRVCGSATAAQQETLLALRMQDQGMDAVGRTVRHVRGMPAAAKPMGFTGFDQANFGKDNAGIIGHGRAYVARMKSG